jgi:hypothetical protein
MEKEFVNYNQALALKELRFDEDCLGRWLSITEWEKPTGEIKLQLGVKLENYDKNQCLAPLKQQVFRWFREVNNLSGIPTDESYEIWKLTEGVRECIVEVYPLETYEESESACIDKLIEICKI